MTSHYRRISLERRTLLMVALTAPLFGCDNIAPFGLSLDQWQSALKMATGLQKAPELQRDQVAQIPFATISYQVGSSPTSILILAEKLGTGSLWTSSQRLAIVTAKGRILQTSGFRWNLGGTNLIDSDPVGTSALLDSEMRKVQRLCDFPDIHQFQIPIVADFESQKAETISILGSDIETTRVVEHCRCEALDWDFDNFYWIDQKTGFVWRSKQYVHPNEAHFGISVLRPEA
jgi:hypothetical protein